ATWATKIVALINRLKTLISEARFMTRVAINATVQGVRGTISGVAAQAIVTPSKPVNFQTFAANFSASAIGGGFATPFMRIGTNIASRPVRIITTGAVSGVSDSVGGTAGDWVASQITGEDFNL